MLPAPPVDDPRPSRPATPEVRREGAVARVLPGGDLDLLSARRLREAVDVAVRDPDADGILLDLREVGFVDSAGMASLLNGARRATRAGRGFAVLVAPEGRVTRALDRCRLLPTLGAETDEAVARDRAVRRPPRVGAA